MDADGQLGEFDQTTCGDFAPGFARHSSGRPVALQSIVPYLGDITSADG
jgi:hypothetical protein